MGEEERASRAQLVKEEQLLLLQTVSERLPLGKSNNTLTLPIFL